MIKMKWMWQANFSSMVLGKRLIYHCHIRPVEYRSNIAELGGNNHCRLFSGKPLG
jgi:hypothetical protein